MHDGMRIIHIGNSRRAGDEQEIWGITAAENAQHTAKKQDIYFFEQKNKTICQKNQKIWAYIMQHLCSLWRKRNHKNWEKARRKFYKEQEMHTLGQKK